MAIDYTKSILIIDDMQMVRQTLAGILRKSGFTNLSYASNGQFALDEVQSKPVELILLDWNMPEVTGIDFLRQLRKTEGHEKTPVIMITAENMECRIREAAFEGISGYILKPFTPKTVLQKIFQILQDGMAT